MEEFDLSLSILNDIVDNDIPFSEALKKVFKTNVEKRPYRSTVASLLGCELRHHLLFAYLLNPFELDEEEKRLASLVLSNIAYVKKIDADASKEVLKEKLGEKYALVESLIALANEGKSFIPEDMSKSSNRYLSLRYNTPEWVLKIWQHFGYGVTYKILRKNATPATTYFRVRSPLTVQSLCEASSDFSATSTEDIVAYKGKVAIRKIPEYQRGDIFVEKPGIKALSDRFIVEEPKEVMAYVGDDDSSLLYELIERYKGSVGMNLIAKNADDHLLVSKQLRKMELKNVNFFSAPSDSLTSGISRPQDLVYVAPKSTNFDKIREEPDYLLHFHKQEGEGALYQEEKETLENCSKFVAENGILVYLVRTISRKEGHNTINAFLANHQEFRLLEEKQTFPFESHDTALYYAAMVKQTALVKDTIPLSPLLAEVPGVPMQTNAESGKNN